jgi:hypothetical protein
MARGWPVSASGQDSGLDDPLPDAGDLVMMVMVLPLRAVCGDPKRCWAACRVIPMRVPMAARE